MMGLASLSTLVTSLLLAQHAAAALQPITMKGTKFFYKNGTQFFMKGVAYQQDTAARGGESANGEYVDPLADESKCKRDVPLLRDLGINTIRTYAIDPSKDHSACMKLLDDAGIYVIADLSEPKVSINRDAPLWNTELFKRYTAVIDDLAEFPNVIGFFAGNEVTNNATNTGASAFVKAAVRDSKAYIKKKVNRWMGVGYAANDDVDIRANIAWYFNCGNQDDAIDFWGYNIYSWCIKSSFTESGYDKQVEFFSNYSVPVFFAEYGCNSPGGAEARIFQETEALYSDQMSHVFSGGIVYMYFQEENDYGLVSVSGNKASTLKNYNQLKTRHAEATPKGTPSASYSPTNSPAACPTVADSWRAAEVLPPTPDSDLCDCMFSSLACKPASTLSEKSFGEIFSFICGADAKACAGIGAKPDTGVYGAYSMCSPRQQLGYVLDAYYRNQKNAASACDFGGKAEVVSGGGASVSAAASCSAALSSAASANSVAATATKGTAGSSTGTGGANNAAGPLRAARLPSLGDVAIGAYVLAAAAVGAGMVLL